MHAMASFRSTILSSVCFLRFVGVTLVLRAAMSISPLSKRELFGSWKTNINVVPLELTMAIGNHDSFK